MLLGSTNAAEQGAELDRALVGRFTGISFAVDDINDSYESLRSAGLAFSGEPERQAWGGRLATIVDPSGNELQLVQYS